MKNKWQCDECGEKFDRKKDLVEHLQDELNQANDVVSGIEGQFYELGIDNPYKEYEK